jgi:hypothetical protein
MRKYIVIFFCILIVSCKTQKETLSPFMAVYKENGDGHNIYPSYILLKIQPKIFEIYAPGIYASIVGEWNIANDTLYVFPTFEYYASENKMHMHKITPADSSVTTIPQQYLIKNDCLIDITDYGIILPELFNNQNYKAVYKRVNNQ